MNATLHGRTITICAYNRPDYLAQVLDSLYCALQHSREAGYEWDVIVGIDHSEHECEIIMTVAHARINTRMIYWPEHLGVAEHPRRLIQYAFSELNSTYNVHLEDDTVLSPDALLLALWYSRSCSGDLYGLYGDGAGVKGISKTLCLSLHSPSRLDALQYPHTVTRRTSFGAWGWCCTRMQWRTWFSQHWNSKREYPLGFDWSVSHMMHKHRLYAVSPVLSRVTNIGRLGGTHQTPEGFDRDMEGLIAASGSNTMLCSIVDFILDRESPEFGEWSYGE